MRIVLVGVAALSVILGGYSYWWYTVAEMAEKQILQQKQIWEKKGYEIEHSPIETSGFPYRVKLSLASLTIRKADKQIARTIDTREVWAVVQPWNIKHVIFGTDQRLALQTQKQETVDIFELAPEVALGSAKMDNAGKLTALSIDINNAKIQKNGTEEAALDRLQIHERKRAIKQKTAEGEETSKEGRQLALRIDNLVLTGRTDIPMGNIIKRLAFSSVLEGDWTDLKDRSSAEKWRDAGGILNIDEMTVNWGPSDLDLSGALSLDDNTAPIGALKAKLTGFEQILEPVIKRQGLDKKSARTLSFALNLMAKENEQAVRYLDIPLNLQNGGLYLGPFKLRALDPIY